MGMFIYVPREHHDMASRYLIVYNQFKNLQELPTDTFVNMFYTEFLTRVCGALTSAKMDLQSPLQQMEIFGVRCFFSQRLE
jgi:hypothetical protein